MLARILTVKRSLAYATSAGVAIFETQRHLLEKERRALKAALLCNGQEMEKNDKMDEC